MSEDEAADAAPGPGGSVLGEDAAAHARECERIVWAGDRDRYLATLFAPLDKRPALFSLYAFAVEIARVPERVREPLPGEIRLQWWRDALESGAGEATSNPVFAALDETIARYRLPRAPPRRPRGSAGARPLRGPARDGERPLRAMPARRPRC